MALNPSNLLSESIFSQIYNSAFARILGGATIGGAIVALGISLWNNLGSAYALLCLGGFILGLLLLCFTVLLWKYISIYREKNMESAVEAQAQKKQLKTEIKAQKKKLIDALNELKNADEKIRIYELPWILLVGEPKSGKTTTLRESNLYFPVGNEAISGSGGTLNCDWWFTNDAVIIDTAGRYFIPPVSGTSSDEWTAFLKLLAKYRPRCPINGVIVTIPSTSLLDDDQETIMEKAQKLRDKLLELQRVLCIEFPVNIMISKMDNIFGFTEFFASLSSKEQTQIFGWNFSAQIATQFDSSEFSNLFDIQVKRLYHWTLRRLRDSSSNSEADRIYAFHGEFYQLKESLQCYFETIFKQDRFHHTLFLRGCYFSSGIQEGKSFAKAIIAGVSNQNKCYVENIKKIFTQSTRAYFIKNFYKKIFLERSFVNRSGAAANREKKFKIAAATLTILVSICSAWLLLPGNRYLKQTLHPINQDVNAAINILGRYDAEIPTSTAFEVISLIDSLKSARKNLSKNNISTRFFKGEENFVIKDIKIIEDALMVRGLFRPLISKTIKKIGKKNQNNENIKEIRVSAMKHYLSALSNKYYSDFSPDPFLNILSINNDEWLKNNKHSISEMWKTYPRSDYKAPVLSLTDENFKNILKGLIFINKYWTLNPSANWQAQWDVINEVSTSYLKILDMPIKNGSSVISQYFPEKVNEFISLAQSLLNKKNKIFVLPPNLLEKACFEDYSSLYQAIPEINSKYFFQLKKKINSHKLICSRLKSGMTYGWEWLENKNGHFLDKQGKVNEDISFFIKSLKIALNFGPLFNSSHKVQLEDEESSKNIILKSISKDWKIARDQTEKEITTKMQSILSDKWQKKRMLSTINHFLDNVLWIADRDAALLATNIISEKLKVPGSFQPGIENQPSSIQPVELQKHYNDLLKINKFLKINYPANPERNDISADIKKVISESYRNYMGYWKKALLSYSYSNDILNTDKWNKYRKMVIEKQGIFINIEDEPLHSFLELMTLSQIQQIKDLLGKKLVRGTYQLEKIIKKSASLYGAPKKLAALDASQTEFYLNVKQLSENEALAWNTLKNNNFENWKSLERFFSKYCRSEPVSRSLPLIESHGIELLKTAVFKEQKKQWDNFKIRKTKLSKKFPFNLSQKPKEIKNNIIRKLIFSTPSLEEFQDFFFKDPGNLEELCSKYQLFNQKPDLFWKDKILFLKACMDWRNFLFDKAGNAKLHQIEVRIDTTTNEVDSLFTELHLVGFFTKQHKGIQRLRLRGKERHRKGIILWSIEQHQNFTIKLYNDTNNLYSILNISGDALCFPAYMYTQGRHLNHGNEKERIVDLKLPHPHYSKNKTIAMTVIFQLKEKLPEIPLWP